MRKARALASTASSMGTLIEAYLFRASAAPFESPSQPRNVARFFHTAGASPARAVSAVSFSIAEGEIFGFLGPNGAGKTTTISMISCLLTPTSGDVKVKGSKLLVRGGDLVCFCAAMHGKPDVNPSTRARVLAMVQSLQALIEQTTNKVMRDVIRDVCTRVEGGDSFSEALQKHPKAFSRLYVCMVAAGEKGGLLAEILARLATYLENAARLRKRVKSAMMLMELLLAFSFSARSVIDWARSNTSSTFSAFTWTIG